MEILKKDRFSLKGLLGSHEFGASLGYDVVQRGDIAVSVLAGAAHPYHGNLKTGWSPVAGFGLRF